MSPLSACYKQAPFFFDLLIKTELNGYLDILPKSPSIMSTDELISQITQLIGKTMEYHQKLDEVANASNIDQTELKAALTSSKMNTMTIIGLYSKLVKDLAKGSD